MCFLIYALVGHFALNDADPASTPTAGTVLIVFSCLFIVAFATTWGPLVWAIVAELYPARYRAQCMALATASNWLFNFLISLFTQLIVGKIHWLYGLVFSGCSLALFFVVYLFVIESKDRSLEGVSNKIYMLQSTITNHSIEIDTMYILHVNPITSAKWDGSKTSRDTDSGHTHAHHAIDDEETGKNLDPVTSRTAEKR